MEPIELGAMAAWINGSLQEFKNGADGLSGADSLLRGKLINSICTDSRKVKPGDVFWPLIGEKFDGHDYIAAAVAAGAACVVCARDRLPKVTEQLQHLDSPTLTGLAVVVVDNTLVALAGLAGKYREQFGIPVIAVTGSAGKTTTKDLTAAVLAKRYCTLKTMGNYNNEIGLPLTLLNLNRHHQAAVVEMGMRGPDQIRSLAAIAKPSVGIVTNVEPVHVELLGSIEAIAKAKQELVESLPPEGTAVLNWDNPWVRNMAKVARCRVLTYGVSDEADLRILSIESLGDRGVTVTFAWNLREYKALVPIPGKHNAHNAAAAVLAGIASDLTMEECISGLADYEGSGLRMEITRDQDGTVLVNDSYNANPQAMRAAINATLDVANGRKVWLILGDMLELGALAESAHRDLGRWIGGLDVERLICVGEYGNFLADGARMAGFPADQVVVLSDAVSCSQYLADKPWKGTVLLVKGSRGVGLDQVAGYLLQNMSCS